MKRKYIIFDLDDTLMYEIEYLQSAYREISEFVDKINGYELYDDMIKWYIEKQDVFGILEKKYSHSKIQLLEIYRNHFPNIEIAKDVKKVLGYIRENSFKLGLISDGRSVTQRNKLKALNIEGLFDRIVISEEFGSTKPNFKNYEIFMNDHESFDFFYIGDNTTKDFIAPNNLGWTTIAIRDSGRNIHKQDFECSQEHKPQFIVDNIKEIIDYIG